MTTLIVLPLITQCASLGVARLNTVATLRARIFVTSTWTSFLNASTATAQSMKAARSCDTSKLKKAVAMLVVLDDVVLHLFDLRARFFSPPSSLSSITTHQHFRLSFSRFLSSRSLLLLVRLSLCFFGVCFICVSLSASLISGTMFVKSLNTYQNRADSLMSQQKACKFGAVYVLEVD